MRNIVLTATATGALAACSPQGATPTVDAAKVSEEIKADVDKLAAQFNAHDAEGAVAHDAADYVGMFHGQPNIAGQEADLAVTKQQLSDPAAKITVNQHNIDVAKSGEMAVDRTSYSFDYTDPKTRKVVTEHGNWVLGYKQQTDKTWKLAWSVVSDTGQQATGATGGAMPAAAQ